MKSIIVLIISVLTVVLLVSMGCDEVREAIPKHSDYVPPIRDSIQIQYTLNRWGKQQVHWFWSRLDTGLFYPKPIIDTIFYDSTYTKFIGTVVLEYDSIEMTFNNEVKNLHGVYIIGYRNDTNSIWKIFQFDIGMYQLFNSKEKLSRTLRNKLYHELKGQGEICSDTTKNTALRQDVYYRTNQYNLYTPGFWTKSPYWTKSLRIKGYYNFETVGNVGWDEPDPLEKRVIVQYPDSIKQLFGK